MTNSATHELRIIPGVQIAEFDGSTVDKTYRVEMADGRHFQINEMLHWLLNCLNIPHTLAELRDQYSRDKGEVIDLEQLTEISSYLQAQGLIHAVGEEPVTVDHKNSTTDKTFLSLHYRRDIIPARFVAPIAKVLSVTFTRTLVFGLAAIVLLVHGMIVYEFGLVPNIPVDAINWPLFYTITLLGVLVHELGHLAACARWNCPHGPLGVGFYFLNPIFYVDVTNAWRLKRWQRVVVDLGGIYLEAFMMPLLWILYLLTSDPTYIMAILITDMLILTNFEPFMKLDGYWLLSDLTGVPNLHKRTGELLKDGLAWLMWRVGLNSEFQLRSQFNSWSPKIRRIILAYSVVSVCIWPLILAMLVPMIYTIMKSYPALWLEAWLDVVQGMQTHDWSLIWGQAQVLFLPTIALLNVAIMVRMSYKRIKQQRQERDAA